MTIIEKLNDFCLHHPIITGPTQPIFFLKLPDLPFAIWHNNTCYILRKDCFSQILLLVQMLSNEYLVSTSVISTASRHGDKTV